MANITWQDQIKKPGEIHKKILLTDSHQFSLPPLISHHEV